MHLLNLSLIIVFCMNMDGLVMIHIGVGGDIVVCNCVLLGFFFSPSFSQFFLGVLCDIFAVLEVGEVGSKWVGWKRNVLLGEELQVH
jgi:hypothetical protein